MDVQGFAPVSRALTLASGANGPVDITLRLAIVEQVEVSGILKSSPHQDLARQFLAYMASTEGQKTLPTTNWMYPVIDLGTDLPPAFGTQPAKVLPVDEATVTAQRNAWIEEALAAIR